MRLIGLHGLPRSGKDTIALILANEFGFTRIAFADPLKKAAAVLLNRSVAECQGVGGFDREAVMPEWGFSMRWFLQKFGTECLRDVIREDFWIRRAELEIDRRITRDEKVNLVFTDVRFPNEAALIRARDGLLVRVVRPGVTASTHPSDRLLECDVTVHNNGTITDLFQKIALNDVLKLKEDLTV